MSEKRFDISQASQFESRDGGITKGGLIRNGFTDVDGAGERWANMRPALATTATGSPGGLGLFVVGSNLCGMGTAGSWQVQLGLTNFSLNAQWQSGTGPTGNLGMFEGNSIGSLAPSTWGGTMVVNDMYFTLQTAGTSFTLAMGNTCASNRFTKVVVNGATYMMSAGTFSFNSQWTWPGASVVATGVYSGGYL